MSPPQLPGRARASPRSPPCTSRPPGVPRSAHGVTTTSLARGVRPKQAARLPQHPPALVHREQLEQVGARHHVGLPVRQRHVTRVAAQGSPAFWEPAAPRARPMWPPRSLPRCSRRVGRLSERRGRRPPAPGATPGHPSIGRSVQRRRIVSPGEPPGIGVLPAASKLRARPRGDPRAQVCFPGVHAEAGRSTAARSQRLPAQLRIWKLASRCASGHTDRPSSPLDYLQMIDLNIVGLYLVAARKARDTFRRSGPRMHPQASVTAPAPGLGCPPRGRTTKPPAATYAGSATGPARVARLRTSTRRRGFERRAPRRPLGSERRGPSWRQR